MIHYNNDNSAYCSAVNAKKFETKGINKYILIHKKPIEIFICIYSVRGEIYQISTNTFIYIYIYIYIYMYNLLHSKCLHVCLHIDWSPYCTCK